MKLNPLAVAVGVNVVLACGLAFLWQSPDAFRWQEPAPIRPEMDTKLDFGTLQTADVSVHRETNERPLFAANRRPAPKATESDAAAPEETSLNDVRLLGLYSADGRGGVILSSGGRIQRVPIGGQIGGWTLSSADGRNVSLVRGGSSTKTLQMPLIAGAPVSVPASGKTADASSAQPVSGAPAVAARRPAPSGARQWAAPDYQADKQLEREVAARINERRARRGLPSVGAN